MPLDLSPTPTEVPEPAKKEPRTISLKNIIVGVFIGAIVIATLAFVASSFIYPSLLDLFMAKEATETSTKIITKTSTSSAQKDETEDWKVYSNETMAFSIKYPEDEFSVGADPKITFGQSQITFTSKKNQYEILMSTEKSGTNLKANYDEANKAEIGKQSTRSIGVLTTRQNNLTGKGVVFFVTNVDAGSSEGVFTKFVEVDTKNQDTYYSFAVQAYSTEELEKGWENFKKMLSTFKFLD